MIAHHFGTDEIPRQCVTPGDYVLHEGRTYIASANNIKKPQSARPSEFNIYNCFYFLVGKMPLSLKRL